MNALSSLGGWSSAKHRRRLEDLVDATQLVTLARQAPDLLTLLRRQ
jgi:hypothetical protein